jgi:hypothetical protein
VPDGLWPATDRSDESAGMNVVWCVQLPAKKSVALGDVWLKQNK